MDVNYFHFANQAFNAGLGWSVTLGKLGNDWAPNHKNQRYHFDHDGTSPYCPEFQNLLINEFRCPHKRWKSGNRPRTPQDTTFRTFPVLPVDIAFYCSTYIKNGKEMCAKKHAMVITEVTSSKIGYGGPSREKISGDLLATRRDRDLEIIHIPDVLMGCRDLMYYFNSDSTFTIIWYWRHLFKCCWHENLAGTWPWFANPTAYPCLSWTESRGTTWDTLISPRANMAGCTSVVFIQSCTTNLLHGSNKTIEIRGSTDDGATWPYRSRLLEIA